MKNYGFGTLGVSASLVVALVLIGCSAATPKKTTVEAPEVLNKHTFFVTVTETDGWDPDNAHVGEVWTYNYFLFAEFNNDLYFGYAEVDTRNVELSLVTFTILGSGLALSYKRDGSVGTSTVTETVDGVTHTTAYAWTFEIETAGTLAVTWWDGRKLAGTFVMEVDSE